MKLEDSRIELGLKKVTDFCEKSGFKGYDPYDTLNSPLNFAFLGKWGPAIAIQVQKRNPVNIRPLLRIKKGLNPKGLGLMLKAYTVLYQKTGDTKYIGQADWLFEWLINNYSQGYSGMCWGYNFDWANPDGTLPAYTPSVVVTSFVVDGIYEYYKITNNQIAGDAVVSASRYILNDIPVTDLPEGISFSYTHLSKGCCYNASLLAAEILAKADRVSNSELHKTKIHKAVDFVLSRQKNSGEWWYSYNPDTGTERKQIDFHQGFVLVSLANLMEISLGMNSTLETAIQSGLHFYRNNQFQDNGQSFWRLPKTYPVDIHNQSQGIITFSKLRKYNPEYYKFALTIANWTVENMQSSSGHFYFRKTPFFMNRIPYMRWSQAWMMLALAEVIFNGE